MEDQIKPQQTWWQKHNKLLMRTGLIALLVVIMVLIILIILGYFFQWDWTGLTATDKSKPTTNIIVYQPGKTLWDWLQLLGIIAIPVVVGLGAAWYTVRQSHDIQITIDNQRERALQAYIDKMTDMKTAGFILNDDEWGKRERIAARARTLTILPSLDANRKRTLLQFLYDLEFLDKSKPRIKLNFADLSGANLTELNLAKAYLAQSNFSGANLRGAILTEACLPDAILDKADLSRANLKGVTGITVEELEKQALSLTGATMPDGSVHP